MSDEELQFDEAQELLLAAFAFMHPVPLKLAQATAICEAFLDYHKMDYKAATKDLYDRTSLERLREGMEKCTAT